MAQLQRGRMRGFDLGSIRPGLVVKVVFALALLIWVVAGGPAYTVAPDEQGVVLTFGRYTGTMQPGFHMKWPWPIQTVEKPQVAEVKRIEIGFRSTVSADETNYETFLDTPSLRQESQMLTGDENVVDCSMAVQFRIKNPLDFLFNFRPGEAESTLRAVGEAALRQAVGDHPIDDVLTVGKVEVQNEIRDKIQELADAYEMGVTIVAVQLQDVQPPADVAPAFRDVATAREEREKIINEAQAYSREQIPKAEGEAVRIRQVAEGYKEARVAEAQGEMARFTSIAKQYDAAPEITRTRLHLEAAANLLSKMKVTVIDENAGITNLRLFGPPTPLEVDALEKFNSLQETGQRQETPDAPAEPAGKEAQ